jgi:tetratricopeptide (TPR) repeat protein
MPKTNPLLFVPFFLAFIATMPSDAAPTAAKAAKSTPATANAKAATEEKPKANSEHDSLEFNMEIGLGSKAWAAENFPEATKNYKNALEFAQSHFLANDIRIAQAGLYLARAQNFGTNDYDAADKSYELSRDVLKKAPGDNNFILGDVLFELACVYAKQGRTAESDALLDQAMVPYKMLYGPDDNHPASVLHRQGKNLISEGKPDKAVPLLEESASIFEKKQTWSKLASTYTDLADAYGKIGKTAEAAETKKKADKVNLEHPKAGDPRIE